MNGLFHIDSVVSKSDGTFTKTIRAGGPTWDEDDKYKIKISYGGNLEKIIDYQKTSYHTPQPTEPKNSLTETSPTDEIPLENLDISFTENPKMRIFGFPSFDKSPQYHIGRYNNEPEYQSWFDSQFPEQTIYSVLGFSTFIHDWIKAYAKNWEVGDVSDDEFMTGLDFMLQNKIIMIPNFTYDDSSIDHIPSWFRNTSH